MMEGLFGPPSPSLAGGTPLTSGSIPFANASGALVGDNVNFRYVSGLFSVGSGDNQTLYTPTVVPRLASIRDGTAASPVTASGPTLKVVRTEQLTHATIVAANGGNNTDGADQVGAIMGISSALASSETQSIGVMGTALSQSTVVANGTDACGGYFVGRHTGTHGTGIGAFIAGRRDTDSVNANALEVHAANYGTTDAPWSSTGFSLSQAIWANCSGNADSGAAFTVSNAFGRQFDVGIGFTAQVTGGKTGGVKNTSINDQSNSLSAHTIGGSHNYGIDLPGTFANSAIRAGAAPGSSFVDIFPPAATTAMTIRNATAASNVLVVRTSSGTSALFINDGGTTFNNNLGYVNQGTVGESMVVKYSEELLTLSTSGTTTDSAGNLLPAGALILGVSTRITTTIATATNWSVGDATTAARFSSANSTLTAGTTQNGINQANGGVAAGAGIMQTSAAKVRITTTGTPSAGAVRITVAYIQLTAPTS